MGEKLIIKNFGPIKSVDLDLKKVTVLIGDQGTGKSALAKLLYVISSNAFLFSESKERIRIVDSYGLFFKKNSEVEYTTDQFKVSLAKGNFAVSFHGDQKEKFEEFHILYNNFTQRKYFGFKDWFDGTVGEYKYVPAERIALTTTLRLIRNTSNRSLYQGNFDQYILDFADYYDKASEKVTEFDIPHLSRVSFKKDNNIEKVTFNSDNLFLYQTSSGFQVSIPLVIFFEYYTNAKNYINKFIIEEPELNLFPLAQYELTKFFIGKINPLKNSLLLTTHSPYILTSLNNLIQGHLTGRKRGKKQKTIEIIPQQYWLDANDVTAYMLKYDEKAKGIIHENILDEDGLIMAEKIDGVSRILNEEFDKLLNIEFGIKK